MALGPLIQGSYSGSWTVTLKKRDNSAFALTGATITGVLFNENTANRKTLAGTFSVTDAANGIFTYTPVAADVDTPGTWSAEFCVTQGAKPLYVRTPLTIEPRRAA